MVIAPTFLFSVRCHHRSLITGLLFLNSYEHGDDAKTVVTIRQTEHTQITQYLKKLHNKVKQ
jgi:hypothetical protein